METTPTTKLEWALWHAEQGWRVFPCAPGEKTPIAELGVGVKGATGVARQIEAWWSQYPDANIGGTGYFVLDLDNKPDQGVDGSVNLAIWCLEQGVDLPETLEFRSARGGRHLVYDVLEGAMGQGTGSLPPGVDIRAPGLGYILLPGSAWQGRPYTVAVDRPIATAPAAIVAESCKGRVTRPDELVPEGLELDHPVALYRAREVAKRAAPAVQGHNGEPATFELACLMFDFAVTPAAALEILMEEWSPRCSPPWQADELMGKLENAWQYRQNTVGGGASGGAPSAEFMALTRPGSMPERAPVTGKLLTDDEVLDRPPMAWLLEGFLPERGIGLLYGDSGTFKSFLALDLCLSIAHQLETWAGCNLRPGSGRVVYMTAEGDSGMSKRIAAWRSERKLGSTEGRFRYAAEVPYFLDAGDDTRDLVAEVAAHDPELVVIDTLSQAMAGGNENATEDASRFMREVYRLRALGIAVILVLHISHDGSAKAKAGEIPRPRGAMDFWNKSDAAWFADAVGPLHSRLRIARLKDGDLGAPAKHFRMVARADSLAAHYTPPTEGPQGLTEERRQELSLQAKAASVFAELAPGETLSTSVFAQMLAEKLYPEGALPAQIETLRGGLRRVSKGYKATGGRGGRPPVYTCLARFVVPGTEGEHLTWRSPPVGAASMEGLTDVLQQD